MDVAPLAPAGAPAQAHLAVAEQVRPALADAVLFLAEAARALVPVARAQAQLVEDEGHERAVVARGPLRVVVFVVVTVIVVVLIVVVVALSGAEE